MHPKSLSRPLKCLPQRLFLLTLLLTLCFSSLPLIISPIALSQPRSTSGSVFQSPLNQSPPALIKHQEIRGVWITNNDTKMVIDQQRLQAGVEQLAQMNFNTLYPVVWNSGYAWYPSPVAQRYKIQPFVRRGLQGYDIIQEMATQAHQRGLLVMPWFEFGFMAPPGSELATAYPQWLTQTRTGAKTSISAAGEVNWLNPFHPEVQKFITELVVEVVTQYDVDGIQFDDHMGLPSEFGYDPYTIALYKKETKKDPPINPRDLSWLKWRANKLTDFMVQLNQAVKASKPQAIFSVAPNPYTTAYQGYLQDWTTWIEKGIVDELIVQVYRPDLASFVTEISQPELKAAQEKIPSGVAVLTGLRNRFTPMSLIRSKVLQARERGLGVSFFYYESLWDLALEPPAERKAAFQALFFRPAPRSRHSI